MSSAVPTYVDDEPSRVTRIESDISSVTKAVSGLQRWRAWMAGALAVLALVVTVGIVTVPWMVRSAVTQVLIEHRIIKYDGGSK